jgi:aminotransferase in exopolysaccharide biosynthesis
MNSSKKLKIPLSVPTIRGNELKYIKECLEEEWVSSAGKYVDKFEKEIAGFTGSNFAVACVNGTSALHIALLLVGIKPDDEVIVPVLTFIASVNVVRYVGANPIFMDCDEFYNIDSNKTIEFIKNETIFKNGFTYNKKTNKRIYGIIPVHIFGNPVYLDELFEVCKERNLKIIEDAAESLGSTYISGKFKKKHTGTIGDIGCLSFNGNKIITSGGGGMILSQNEEYAKRARYLTTQAKDDGIRYIHNEIGYNFRPTNIQAALGVAQLERLSEYLEIKKKNYEIYKREIDKIPGLRLAPVPTYANCNYWMYCLQIDKDVYKKDKEGLLIDFLKNQVEVRPVWQLNNKQQPYKHCQSYKIEKADELSSKTLNIPCSVSLIREQIDKVLDILKQ